MTVPVSYKGVNLDCGYKLDLLIEDTVILELKCVERITSVHEAQLLTYMKLLDQTSGVHYQFQCTGYEGGYRPESIMTCLSPCLRASVVNKDSASPRLRGERAFAAAMGESE